jgi:hypothetical protein
MNMFKMKPGKLLATALFGAAVGFFQPASAITLTFDPVPIDGVQVDSTATVGCSGGPTCKGFIDGGDQNVAPSHIGTEDENFAWLYNLGNSGTSTETTAMNTIAGQSFLDSDLTSLSFDSLSGIFKFFTTAEYFLIKIGGGQTEKQDTAFFHVLGGGLVTVLYNPGSITGLSHVSAFGGRIEIPLPAALPMFLLMLGGTALVARRRKQAAA